MGFQIILVLQKSILIGNLIFSNHVKQEVNQCALSYRRYNHARLNVTTCHAVILTWFLFLTFRCVYLLAYFYHLQNLLFGYHFNPSSHLRKKNFLGRMLRLLNQHSTGKQSQFSALGNQRRENLGSEGCQGKGLCRHTRLCTKAILYVNFFQ